MWCAMNGALKVVFLVAKEIFPLSDVVDVVINLEVRRCELEHVRKGIYHVLLVRAAFQNPCYLKLADIWMSIHFR